MTAVTHTSPTDQQYNTLMWAGLLIAFQVVMAIMWVYHRMTRGKRTASFGMKPVVTKADEYDAFVIGENIAGFTVLKIDVVRELKTLIMRFCTTAGGVLHCQRR